MAKTQNATFFLPPGRIVGGSTHDLQTKDQQGRDREKPSIYFAVAVPKNSPGVGEVLALINQVAYDHYGNHPTIKEQLKLGLAAPNFAWKVEDGDADKNKGREGYAGCWVFRFATSIFPIKAADSNDNPIDPSMIKTGYYIDVKGNVAPNELTDKNAGVYLNPNGVRLLGYGQIIVPGESVKQMFAGRPATLPPGASAMPLSPDTPTPGAPGPIGGIGGTAPATPAPAGPGFAGGIGAPATPAAPPPPPPASVAPVVRTVEQIQAESAQLSAAAGWPHTPGFRPNATRTAWEADPLPGPVAPTAATPPVAPGIGGPAAGVSANPLGGGVGVPAAPAGAPLTPAAGSGLGATASPSSPPVQPHPGFLTPPVAAPRTVEQIQAESAQLSAAAGWPHTPGFRPNATRTAWEADPVL